MLKILSLGWGVQSWTVAAMVALGDLPSIDYAVHADTSWERSETYTFAEQWGGWLKERGVNVKTLLPAPRSNWILNNNEFVQIPAFSPRGNSAGQLKRQCTSNWKIHPIRRFVRAELKRRGEKASPGAVEMQLGITTDEWIRAKQSGVKYITHSFPLLDAKMSRADCINYLNEKGIPVPPKSSCTFCPFHSLATWQNMKREGGADWEQVVEVDKVIRNKRPPRKIYLLRDCIPIEKLPIPEDYGYKQSSFLDEDNVTCDSGYCFM